LAENLGRMPKEQIAKRLKRSENALKIAAYRKLNGINQRSNIYTARNVAELLGIPCSKTIIAWMEKGYIKGKRAPFAYGKHLVWSFEYEDIEACLRERPWLVNIAKMERSYFKTIVKEEYEKDPWYTCAQAATFLGLVDINAVHRYIHRGWLPAVRKPGGPWQGVWIFRQSAIDAFLKNDPRPERRRCIYIKSKRRKWLDDGRPVALLKEWLIRCSRCGHKVRIIANPNLRSPQIKAQFYNLYVNGTCSHGKKVLLESRIDPNLMKGG
jgi:predicted site-specific integrase-resolvase